MSHHTCHAHECPMLVPPRLFMCLPHWRSLAKVTRDAVWREYRPGQEIRKNPSLRYLAVQRFAVGEACMRSELSAKIASRYFEEAMTFRQRCIDKGLGDPLGPELLRVRDALIPPPRARARKVKHAS